MRDINKFAHCVHQLEKHFGHETKRVMLTLSGIVNHELKRLESSYDKESAEALANLYQELHLGGEKLTHNLSYITRSHRDIIEEFFGRALNASLSPQLTQRHITSYRINGDIVVAVESRHPRTALMMARVYAGNVPDLDYAILHSIETQTSQDGLPYHAKQPIKLKLS